MNWLCGGCKSDRCELNVRQRLTTVLDSGVGREEGTIRGPPVGLDLVQLVVFQETSKPILFFEFGGRERR